MDHNKLLGEASRYKRVREAQDPEACIAVHECGYATDPYSNKLITSSRQTTSPGTMTKREYRNGHGAPGRRPKQKALTTATDQIIM